MTTTTILVVGATGQQGGAVISSLLTTPPPSKAIHILALTRDTTSPRAQSLLTKYGSSSFTLIQGDSSAPSPIFANHPHGSITSLFLVTTMGKISEEAQALPLIDAAVAHGVQHIVFSSVDRGGDEKSWRNPTQIKHFYEKHNVEVYLRSKAEKEKTFTWTILRPVAFMDNFNPGFGPAFASMWAVHLGPEQKLQLVGVRDIGVAAARALMEPGSWAGRAVGLAGDELTLEEAKGAFRRATGKELPQSWGIMGRGLLLVMREIRLMFDFFRDEGYGVRIGELKREIDVQVFEEWVRENKAFAKE